MALESERRHFWRAAFHMPARLTTEGETHYAQVLDLSLKGALLETAADLKLAEGESCQIRIDLATDAAIVMWTKVAHVAGRCIGLHCERIDIDSMMHLRRVVELNAGDPAVLDRDLATLVAEGVAA